MADRCVVDTCILQKANAMITVEPGAYSDFRRRVALLLTFVNGTNIALFSDAIVREYEERVKEPRNDYVRLFFELVTAPGSGAMASWAPRWRGDRDVARRCRFPKHDDHLLRTAVPKAPAVIYTEEAALVRTDACVHRRLQVHILPLPRSTMAGRLSAG